jgi:prephenate dehydratase
VAVLCCETVSKALWSVERDITDLVPLVNTAPGPLSSVLDLLELADRHGAECEELQAPLAGLGGANGGMSHTPVIIA